MKNLIIIIPLVFLLNCADYKENSRGGMKCGAGKCGISMASGSDILITKKMNILEQLENNDTRKSCVLDATSTKMLYNCVRDRKTRRLKK